MARNLQSKKPKPNEHPDEEFLAQVFALSGLRHDNVIQLLGYEYAVRGSLHDVLHGKNSGPNGFHRSPVLSWVQRVKIALGAAKGIGFLHEKTESPVVHANIKSSNIFLFENDVAKIGDIGVPKPDYDEMDDLLLDCIYRPPGYDAPEHMMVGLLSTKGDVYRFGIVLLKLLTGHMAFDFTLPRGQQNLVNWAAPKLTKGKVEQCVDPRLGGEYHPKAIAMIAALCVQFKADLRPDISIVVKALSRLLQSIPSDLSHAGEASGA